MTIYQGERPVVSITITDTATGAYQVTQLAPINHPQGTIPGTEDNVQFTVSYQVTDKDGDAAATPGTLTINVDDDIPLIGENALVQLDDDALSGGNPEGNGDDADSVNAKGVLAHSYGADGAGSVLWIGSGLTLPAGFTATPSEDGKVMTIYQGERPVVSITITDTATGAYQVTQLAPINHPQGTIPGTEDNVQFMVSYQVTDKDGDAAATPGTLTINVDDDIPVVVANETLQLDDDTLGGSAGGEGDDTPTATSGVLGHSFGADGPGSISWSASGLTLPSGFWFVRSEDGSQLTITQNQNGAYVPVFKLVIDNAATGDYHVVQLAPVNHQGTNPGFEDNISVTVSYEVKDGDNDVATGTLKIDIDDDTAKIGTPFAGGIVEEEQGVVIGAGNEDTSGTGDADGFGGFLGLQFQDRTTNKASGTLAISWGSDNADNEMITSGAGNRSVAFGPAAIANLDAQNLTSRGLELVYTLSADGTVLTAHAGTETGQAVFTVTLSDNGSGTYTFTLIDTLDHPVSGEDQIALNFQFTATDSDGDTTAPATFIVKVIDDVPTAGNVGDRYVEEEALAGGNEDVSPLGVEATGAWANLGPITDKIGASLNISWGGDDSNTVANGGFTGTQVMGDRSVVFAASGAAATVVAAADAAAFLTVKSGNTTLDLASLTSGGQALVYTLSANGTVLTAHAGSANGAAVFTVTLSDAGKGSYSFDLDGVIDHPVKASGASNEDVLTFNFTATARDSDGDIVKNNFQVNVIDDSPIANPGTASTVEDESVNSGNNEPEDGHKAKAEHVSLNIQWGADNANDANGQPGDRSVAFSNANVTVVGEAGNSLTSLGVAVHTAILANGTLVGYTGNTPPTTTGAGNVVFFATVSDVNNGEYNFHLVKPLDHDTSPSNSENSLSLTFNYTATDSDGDTSSSTFTVNVVDDVAKIGTPFAGGIVEEEQGVVIGAGNEDTSGAGDADALFGLLDRTTQTTGGTLAISWGSDNADNDAITSGAGNRSVAFGPAAITNLDAQNLTSRGLELVYTLSADGTVLTAHAGTETGQTVFTVTLSDNGSGSYTFTLIDTLDHPVSGEDQIALNFQFTATDSDGDTTAPATFIVNVIDDVPTAGTVFARYVEEEALSGGNEDVSPFGVELTGAVLNGGPITDKIGASLNISWGGDDSNTVANGGFTGTQVMGDRRCCCDGGRCG
jgi:T1SS-143 domain-containing protein